MIFKHEICYFVPYVYNNKIGVNKMITKQDFKDYDCEDIYGYFSVIRESRLNGQMKQAKLQYSAMKKYNRMIFLIEESDDLEFYAMFEINLK